MDKATKGSYYSMKADVPEGLSITIEYYENGSTTPIKVKSLYIEE